MSIFWLGGTPRKVSAEEILPEMYEERIFLPGVLHGGEDYAIRVYLSDVCTEGDPEVFIIEYLTRDLILRAHNVDPQHDEYFNDILVCECEGFYCENDGSGDFAAIIEAWSKSVVMSNSDLVDWAMGKHRRKSSIDRDDLPEFLGQIIDTFEDFLDDKGIDIPNGEKSDSDNPAIIYGSDYGRLQSEIEELLINWNLVEASEK